ncbi:hypothetical protein [Lacticaseibacillus absianus]|uniref:hypothetical protein n=1 Tax=Lacticaseibacillus absianus TaxID=2729623 RepID=UPI0015CB2DEA|nr:hypothetical protein [Lacticaseibacillus absianus]
MKTSKRVYVIGREQLDGTIEILSPCYVKQFAAEKRLAQLQYYGPRRGEAGAAKIYEATGWHEVRDE